MKIAVCGSKPGAWKVSGSASDILTFESVYNEVSLLCLIHVINFKYKIIFKCS